MINNLPVEVLWLSESRYFFGSSLREHKHDSYYQIYYVNRGAGTFVVNGEDFPFEQDTFLLVPPGVSHGVHSVFPGENEAVCFTECKFTVLSEELAVALSEVPPICRGDHALQTTLYQIFLESTERSVFYRELVVSSFSAWIYQVIRLYQDYTVPAENTGRSIQAKPATQVMNWINEHYSEDFSLDTLAQATGYNKHYLCRIFREKYGSTINTCLTLARINRAMDLLAFSNREVEEIGRLCGFNSVHYFIKAFKKHIGIPPGAFRKAELRGEALTKGKVESVGSFLTLTEKSVYYKTPEHDG